MIKAIILLSGGLDSTTLLYHAVKEFGKQNVEAIGLYYGQRHMKEITYAAQTCLHLGVPFRERNISTVMGIGGLTDVKADIPDASYDQLEGVSPTYVPFRNGLLLSIAASIGHELAKKTGCEVLVGYGAHAEDAHNWAYPDCTPEFIGAMANAIYVGTYHQVRLWTPFMYYTKHQIVQVGDKLGVDWKQTWSCYKGENLHCGTCPTCIARKQAFNLADVPDPTQYRAVYSDTLGSV